MMARTMLRVERVTKRFGGLVAVDGLSFDVNEREVLGIIGPNGSGKTTMLNMMSGAFKPTEGFISLSDRQISGKAAQTIARAGVGRTFQLVRLLPGLTVLENVVAGAVFGHRRQWGQSAKMVALRMMERVSLNISPNAPITELTCIDQQRGRRHRERARHARQQPKPYQRFGARARAGVDSRGQDEGEEM